MTSNVESDDGATHSPADEEPVGVPDRRPHLAGQRHLDVPLCELRGSVVSSMADPYRGVRRRR